MIQVSGLSHNRGKKSDPRLAWFMLHRIYRMYSDIKNKEEINAVMVLTRFPEQKQSNKSNKELKYVRKSDENNQHFLQNMIIPSDLNNIQPRATQVWNYGEIGFDHNGRRNKFICTYKFFQGE